MKKKRSSKVTRLLAEYWDLLNMDQAPEPEQYVQAHPDVAAELRPLVETAHQLRGIRPVPKPMSPDKEKQIRRQVLAPILRQMAEQWQTRVNALKDARELTTGERPDLILLLLFLAGRTGRIAEGIRGMIRMMKLLFLAQQTTPATQGLNYDYEFVPFKYGPHSSEVYNDLQVLIWAELVKRTEYDEDNMPVIRRNDYGQMPEDEFAGRNALYELTPTGQAYAELLARDLERTRPELLKQLTALKQQLACMRWQQIVAYVYQKYPEYTTESELLKHQRSADDDYGQV